MAVKIIPNDKLRADTTDKVIREVNIMKDLKARKNVIQIFLAAVSEISDKIV